MVKRMFCSLLLLGLLMMVPAQAREVFLNSDQGESAPTVPIKSGQSAAVASVKYPMQTFQFNYLKAKDMVETVSGLLAEGETVTLNEVINTIIVRADQKTIDRLAKIVEKLDVPPLQVQVEAKIIELKSGNGDNNNASVLGMEWKYTKNANNYIQLTDVATGTAG